MRPASIIRFDQLYLGALALNIANSVYVYVSTIARLGSGPSGDGLGRLLEGVMIGLSAIGFVISLLLWFFISRKASNVAKWLLVVLTVIGTLGSLPLLLQTAPMLPTVVPLWQAVVTLIVTAMEIAAMWFLFRPDANAWFAHGTKHMGPTDFR